MTNPTNEPTANPNLINIMSGTGEHGFLTVHGGKYGELCLSYAVYITAAEALEKLQ